MKEKSREITNQIDTLYKLGLSKEQEECWKDNFNEDDLGRISSQHRELYKTITDKGEISGSICGSLRHKLVDKRAI